MGDGWVWEKVAPKSSRQFFTRKIKYFDPFSNLVPKGAKIVRELGQNTVSTGFKSCQMALNPSLWLNHAICGQEVLKNVIRKYVFYSAILVTKLERPRDHNFCYLHSLWWLACRLGNVIGLRSLTKIDSCRFIGGPNPNGFTQKIHINFGVLNFDKFSLINY